MGWYQTESQQAQWKLLLNTNNFSLSRMLDSDVFMQQLKSSNPDILQFFQTNHELVFEELLTKCLIVPTDSESHARKFKQPTQSINFLQMLLDNSPNTNTKQNLPSSSLTQSVSLSGAGVISGKISSPQVVRFIIRKSFELFQKNSASILINTLVPGFFLKIFELFNKNYCNLFIDYLKTSRAVQQLISKYSCYQQIIKCIQNILVVPFGVNNQPLNINASVSMSMSIAGPSMQQPNYPYEIKYKSIMSIMKNLHNYIRKKDNTDIDEMFMIENFLGIFIEILKSAHTIFQGYGLSETICSEQNVQLFFKLAQISTQSTQTPEIQIKAIELLKYAIGFMTNSTRNNLISSFQIIIQYLLQFNKPTIKTIGVIELLNQWIAFQFGIVQNPLRMQKSVSSSSSFLEGLSAFDIGNITEILSTNHIYKHLIRKCTQYPSYNIFHQRVTQLMVTTFRSKSETIINSVFKENDIIAETVTKVKDFKKNQYFGYFLLIINAYTTHKLNNQCIKNSIEKNTQIWNDFYAQILEPHVEKTMKKLGQMNHPERSAQNNYTVDKSAINKKQNKITQPEIPQKTIKIQEKSDEEINQPIKITLPQTKSQQKQGENQNEQESFQSFLKKKMEESQLEFRKEKKKALSKTPTKMRSISSKKKKWTADPEKEENQENTTRKASNEINLKIENSSQKRISMENVQKIKLIRINTKKMPRKPKQRKIDNKDAQLMSWLVQLQKCAKTSVQAIR